VCGPVVVVDNEVGPFRVELRRQAAKRRRPLVHGEWFPGAEAADEAAEVALVTPPPTPTPAVTPSPVATPTPSPTATPTPWPTPTPSSPAAACTGTASNKALFAQAAGAMNWTVYCAVLPSGWSIAEGGYKNAPNGVIQVIYLYGSSTQFLLYVDDDRAGRGHGREVHDLRRWRGGRAAGQCNGHGQAQGRSLQTRDPPRVHLPGPPLFQGTLTGALRTSAS